jgi:hypothetical protein
MGRCHLPNELCTDLPDGTVRPFVTGKVNVSAVRWAPDGTALFFPDKRGDDKNTSSPDLVEGGEARKAPASEQHQLVFARVDGKRAAAIATDAESESRRRRRRGSGLRDLRGGFLPPKVWGGRAVREGQVAGRARARRLGRGGAPEPGRRSVAIAAAPSRWPTTMMDSRVRVVDAASGRRSRRSRTRQARRDRVSPTANRSR